MVIVYKMQILLSQFLPIIIRYSCPQICLWAQINSRGIWFRVQCWHCFGNDKVLFLPMQYLVNMLKICRCSSQGTKSCIACIFPLLTFFASRSISLLFPTFGLFDGSCRCTLAPDCTAKACRYRKCTTKAMPSTAASLVFPMESTVRPSYLTN